VLFNDDAGKTLPLIRSGEGVAPLPDAAANLSLLDTLGLLAFVALAIGVAFGLWRARQVIRCVLVSAAARALWGARKIGGTARRAGAEVRAKADRLP